MICYICLNLVKGASIIVFQGIYKLIEHTYTNSVSLRIYFFRQHIIAPFFMNNSIFYDN